VLIETRYRPSAPRRGRPIDAADVVTDDVVAQRFELHARAAIARRTHAERREHATRPERLAMEVAARVRVDPQRVAGAGDPPPTPEPAGRALEDDHRSEPDVAPLGRHDGLAHGDRALRRDVKVRMPRLDGGDARRQLVDHLDHGGARARVRDLERDLARATRERTVWKRPRGERRGAARERDEIRDRDHGDSDEPEAPAGQQPGPHDHGGAERAPPRDQTHERAVGADPHRGTATLRMVWSSAWSGVMPSISAAGSSWMR
jgi:hypothetical protein